MVFSDKKELKFLFAKYLYFTISELKIDQKIAKKLSKNAVN